MRGNRVITIAQYFMGRELRFPARCDATIIRNAAETVLRTNQLKQVAAERDGFVFPADEVASGWRPTEINDRTCNAAHSSPHITAQALDTHDPVRAFARWCLKNIAEMERFCLWMEDPRWTPDWVHLQIYAPKSGHRVFIPSVNPPLAKALIEQGGTA